MKLPVVTKPLDPILIAVPFAAYSEVEVFGLTDLQARLERFQVFSEAMAAG